MALHVQSLHVDLKEADPGKRTASLAKAAAIDKENTEPAIRGIYMKLSSMMCWDAALFCAWAANGIHCGVINQTRNLFNLVSPTEYTAMFGDDPRAARVDEPSQLICHVPVGAFVGFIYRKKPYELRHVMIHTGEGWGCGNKNNCVLSAAHPAGFGWELLDMKEFFYEDRNRLGNTETEMICGPVNGQTISLASLPRRSWRCP